MIQPPQSTEIQTWNIDRLVFYVRNPPQERRRGGSHVRQHSRVRLQDPVLARSDGEWVDGHLRLKAARKLGITDVPVILCDEWTEAQVKAFRLMVNRSVTWGRVG